MSLKRVRVVRWGWSTGERTATRRVFVDALCFALCMRGSLRAVRRSGFRGELCEIAKRMCGMSPSPFYFCVWLIACMQQRSPDIGYDHVKKCLGQRGDGFLLRCSFPEGRAPSHSHGLCRALGEKPPPCDHARSACVYSHISQSLGPRCRPASPDIPRR